MTKHKNIGIALLICLLTILSNKQAIAQTDSLKASRIITRATSYGLGFTNVYDTYLSPQAYKGGEFRIIRESMRMTNLFDGNISVQTLFQGNIGYTHNMADNNNMLSSTVNWNYGLHYQFKVAHGLKILAGAVADLNGGFIYNLRNGNNPASARAFINIDASAMAIWHTRIKNHPITLRYQVNLPFMGVMFAPHYGQSYYEIFSLGNWDGVIRFTSIHNQPSVRQWLTVDFPVRYSKLRVSYVADIQQSDVNKVRTHIYSHTFMLGVVKELYRLQDKGGIKLPQSLLAY